MLKNGYCLEVYTRPTAKQRPRFTRGHAYTPKKTKEYEELISGRFIQRYGIPKLKGKICIDTTFKFRIPKNAKNIQEGDYYDKRPDLDNLQKAVLDALNGIAWEDDCQVVINRACKVYAEEDSIEIHIVELGG